MGSKPCHLSKVSGLCGLPFSLFLKDFCPACAARNAEFTGPEGESKKQPKQQPGSLSTHLVRQNLSLQLNLGKTINQVQTHFLISDIWPAPCEEVGILLSCSLASPTKHACCSRHPFNGFCPPFMWSLNYQRLPSLPFIQPNPTTQKTTSLSAVSLGHFCCNILWALWDLGVIPTSPSPA